LSAIACAQSNGALLVLLSRMSEIYGAYKAYTV
jgi:hypothetical protein